MFIVTDLVSLSPIGICYEGYRFVVVNEALARLYGNTCSSKPWFCADAISTKVSLAGLYVLINPFLHEYLCQAPPIMNNYINFHVGT